MNCTMPYNVIATYRRDYRRAIMLSWEDPAVNVRDYKIYLYQVTPAGVEQIYYRQIDPRYRRIFFRGLVRRGRTYRCEIDKECFGPFADPNAVSSNDVFILW